MKKKVFIIIFLIIFSALLVVGAYFGYKYLAPTNNNNNGTHEEMKYLKVYTEQGKALPRESDAVFLTNQTYTFFVNEPFTLSVVSNKNSKYTNFKYVVNESTKEFWNINNLQIAFDISFSGNSFSITLPDGMDMMRVLESVHGSDKTITIPDESINKSTQLFFTILLKSSDGKAETRINFGLIDHMYVYIPDHLEF